MSNTRIGIYQGAGVGGLTLVQRNDDDGLGEPRSRVVFDAIAGQTYRVQVGNPPSTPAGQLLLRWYSSTPDPPQLSSCDLPGSFIANPSLETTAAGWGLTPASASAGDVFNRVTFDGAAGVASAEAVVATGQARGLLYTDPAARSWAALTTLSVWLKVAGGTPRAIVVRVKGNGVRLVPSTGGPDYTVTPDGSWRQFSFDYLANAPAGTGPLTVSFETSGTEATSIVLRADCLQAIETVLPPDAPGNLGCAPADTSIRFSWNAVPGAEGYYVRVNGVLRATVAGTEVVLTGLASGTTYNLSVAAFTTLGGESAQTSLLCSTTALVTVQQVDPSCDALGFLELNGREVFNDARLLAYMRLGLAQPWRVKGEPCDILVRELGLTPRHPAIDPAPWYDSARPESGDFLGAFVKVKLVRHPSRTQTPRESGLGGAAFGPQLSGAELRLAGTLIARSGAGMEYGRAWLEAVLRSKPADPCALSVARVRLSCPPADGSADSRGEWLLYDLALTGDITDGDVGTTADRCCSWLDFATTLTCGNPYLYAAPVACAQGNLNPDPGVCVPLCDWLVGPADGSFATSVACTVVSPHLVGAVAPVVTLSATGGDMKSVTIKLYAEGVACPPTVDTVPLLSFDVPFLPGGGVLVIDNARQLVTFYPSSLDAQNGTNGQPGIPYLSLPSDRTLEWLVSEPDAPGGCVVVGKRTLCGASGTVSIQTQLRQA